MSYKQRILKVGVIKDEEPIFSELNTYIETNDEGAGEFVQVSQCADRNSGTIRIDPEEWPHVGSAIDEAIEGIKTANE